LEISKKLRIFCKPVVIVKFGDRLSWKDKKKEFWSFVLELCAKNCLLAKLEDLGKRFTNAKRLEFY